MSAIIQLGLLDKSDDKLWWCDPWLWDDDTVHNVQRPTEVAAFRKLFRQSRLLKKRGVYINLSPLHMTALRLEYHAMSKPPHPDKVYQWISTRMPGVPPTQVKALLEECSLVTMLRDTLGMKPLVMDWEVETIQKGSRAA